MSTSTPPPSTPSAKIQAGTFRKRTRSTRPSRTDAKTGSRPEGTSTISSVSGSREATSPSSIAQVASAIVPCPHAVEYPALWKKTTPRSAPESSGSVTKQPYMSACPRGSFTRSRRTASTRSAAKRRFSRIVRPSSGSTPPVTIRKGSPAVW